jgi:hypothetical protein
MQAYEARIGRRVEIVPGPGRTAPRDAAGEGGHVVARGPLPGFVSVQLDSGRVLSVHVSHLGVSEGAATAAQGTLFAAVG